MLFCDTDPCRGSESVAVHVGAKVLSTGSRQEGVHYLDLHFHVYTVCPHILQYYLVLYTSCLSFLRTSWVRVILTWSLPRRIQTAATPPLTALRYHFIPYHTTLTLPFWIRDRSLYWLTYLYQLILRSLHRPAKALSHSIPSEASLPILVPF